MKIAIVGAGASGLCCAIEAAKRAKDGGTEIYLFEAKDRVGKKILATGNGRCNMYNAFAGAEDYSAPDFVRGILGRYDVASTRLFFEELGLYTRQDEEGRAYPLGNQASGVLDVLRNECEHLKIKTICDCEITDIKKTAKGFLLSDGRVYDKVVLACGGRAAAKNYGGYELLKATGHRVTRLMPALTKLTVKDNTVTRQLKGIRHKAGLTLMCDSKKIAVERGELLFADYGLSGIGIMQLSSFVARYFREGGSSARVECDFVPDMSFSELCVSIEKICRYNKEMKAEHLLTGFMPKKLGEATVKKAGVSLGKALGKIGNAEIKDIASACKRFSFEIAALRPFDDAQVTSGGADLGDFDRNTLESKKVKNLYCCGELLDIDGPCGGYNLLWAFSSGRAVGESLMK